MKKRFLGILVLIISFLSDASEGTLDTATFNPPNGFVNNPVGNTAISAAAMQTDGKIVVCGISTLFFAEIVRYNTDGSLDMSFGSGGIVTQTNFISADLIIQPDGTILVVGFDATFTHVILVRYLPNGTLDSTFGTNGMVDLANTGFANSVILQSDGKIVIAGGDETFSLVKIIRFFPNGSVDTVFQTTVPDNGGGANGLIIQPDGKIITSNANPSSQLQLMRYNTDGTLDTTFNGTGVAIVPTGIIPILNSVGVLLQPSADPVELNGKIIVGGNGSTGGGIIYLARYNSSNGSLDTTFGVAGIFNVAGSAGTSPVSVAPGLVLQANYKIVITGTDSGGTNFQVVRVTQDGILDVTWNSGGPTPGIITEPPGGGTGSTIQADGKIISVGGTLGMGGVFDFVVARYISSPEFIPTAITSPANNTTVVPGSITFSGMAQNPSMVYLFIDGIFVGGTQTDSGTANTWSITTTITDSGIHTIQAISIYQDKKLNIASEPITLTINSPISCILPSLTNTSELVRSIITKYCCR